MKHKIRKALKGSIRKWEEIVAGKGVDKGGANCPLCQLTEKEYLECDKLPCPIYTKTKMLECQGSPYPKWREHHRSNHPEEDEFLKYNRVYCPTCRKLAQTELDFLKSLLSKESK
jgi:hypothetical protein